MLMYNFWYFFVAMTWRETVWFRWPKEIYNPLTTTLTDLFQSFQIVFSQRRYIHKVVQFKNVSQLDNMYYVYVCVYRMKKIFGLLLAYFSGHGLPPSKSLLLTSFFL